MPGNAAAGGTRSRAVAAVMRHVSNVTDTTGGRRVSVVPDGNHGFRVRDFEWLAGAAIATPSAPGTSRYL